MAIGGNYLKIDAGTYGVYNIALINDGFEFTPKSIKLDSIIGMDSSGQPIYFEKIDIDGSTKAGYKIKYTESPELHEFMTKISSAARPICTITHYVVGMAKDETLKVKAIEPPKRMGLTRQLSIDFICIDR